MFESLKLYKFMRKNPVLNARHPVIELQGEYEPSNPIVSANFKHNKTYTRDARVIVSPFRSGNIGRYFLKLTPSDFRRSGGVNVGSLCQVVTQTQPSWILHGQINSIKNINQYRNIEVVVNFNQAPNMYFDEFLGLAKNQYRNAVFGV